MGQESKGETGKLRKLRKKINWKVSFLKRFSLSRLHCKNFIKIEITETSDNYQYVVISF